jgi:hypothetical protein
LARNCTNEAQPRSVEILDGETDQNNTEIDHTPSSSFRGRGRGRGTRGRGFSEGGGRGGFNTGGRRPIVCDNCGERNHFAKDCQASSITCYNCTKHGHIARDCPKPAGATAAAGVDTTDNRPIRTCYVCGKPGHIARNCIAAKRENDSDSEEEAGETSEDDDEEDRDSSDVVTGSETDSDA